MKFKKEIVPGDKLVIKTEVLSWKRGLLKGIGRGYTNNELAVESEMMISVPDIFNQFKPKPRSNN